MKEETPGPVFGRRDPDRRGYFGEFGGRFVPETLVAPVEALDGRVPRGAARRVVRRAICASCSSTLRRPSDAALRDAAARRRARGVRVFLKREDLAHTGAHKINNALGQALLARRMGKRRIVAETGAGQHGVATATACALLGLECVVYMGAEDMARQALNVFRMRVLGATVERVDAGSRTLKDAINEAMRDWVANVDHDVLPARLGPRAASVSADGARVPVGHRPGSARADSRERRAGCRTSCVACVGGGSNSMGLFDAFVDDASVRLVGVEAGGRSLTPGDHAARFAGGHPGVLHGTRSVVLQDDARQHPPDALGVGRPRLRRRLGPSTRGSRRRGRIAVRVDGRRGGARRRSSGSRARRASCPRSSRRTRSRGCKANLPSLARGTVVLVNLSGRGDKDVETVRQLRDAHGARDEPARGDVRLACATSRGAGLVTYVTAGDPGSAAVTRGAAARSRAAGADVLESRRAVLGSDRGRPGDPARLGARARRRQSPGSVARSRRVGPAADRRAARALHVRQSGVADGLRRIRAPRGRRRRRRRVAARPADRGSRADAPGPRRARDRSDLSRQPDDDR